MEELEQRLTSLLDAPAPLVAVNSGTAALGLALRLAGVGRGELVISTPMTCLATTAAILNQGARILWGDIDPLTGLLDPRSVADLLNDYPQTRAIVAVDWGGHPCDYDALRKVVAFRPIVEDAAHALLASYRGRYLARSGGDYVCWSLGAIKHLTAGDGGLLLCPPEQIERARRLRWYGLDRSQSEDFRCEQDVEELGEKINLNDLAAALALAGLEEIRQVLWRHRQNARYYCERFAQEKVAGIRCPPFSAGSSWWLYTLLVPDRAHFVAAMRERGIQCSRVHARNDRLTAVRQRSAERILPGVTYFDTHQVSLPVGWWLTEGERAHIAESVIGYDRMIEGERMERWRGEETMQPLEAVRA